ncbi:unnamed protein product [Moneuplotes crassus]|uniref:Uncharacterized protein n=1 Tax=Euplotes crassus TaxID=5936 RepID=A0AAD1XAE9_EUPCR|nr:unnamed protein product [Moneuplotes crassus]
MGRIISDSEKNQSFCCKISSSPFKTQRAEHNSEKKTPGYKDIIRTYEFCPQCDNDSSFCRRVLEFGNQRIRKEKNRTKRDHKLLLLKRKEKPNSPNLCRDPKITTNAGTNPQTAKSLPTKTCSPRRTSGISGQIKDLICSKCGRIFRGNSAEWKICEEEEETGREEWMEERSNEGFKALGPEVGVRWDMRCYKVVELNFMSLEYN